MNRGNFDDLLTLHARADPPMRARVEPIIFGKSIEFRTDVRPGRISDDEHARMRERLKAYEASVKQN